MVVTENDLRLSTAPQADWRPRRYIDAEDAVDSYLEMKHLLRGCIGLDLERMGMSVQTSPSAENPHLQKVDDIQLLEKAFAAAAEQATERDWEVWGLVRVKRRSYRDVHGSSKSTVGRIVDKVDGIVEEELYHLGVLVRSAVHLDRERMIG